MNNNTTGVRSLLWAAASVVATIAVMIMLIAVISPPPVNAETPAERCKRETTAYNNAWKNTWAQANPGKSPSQAPPPPVPYKCGGNNNEPPPTVPPTTSEAPETTKENTPEPSNKKGIGSASQQPSTPTDRRALEHHQGTNAPIDVGRGQPKKSLDNIRKNASDDDDGNSGNGGITSDSNSYPDKLSGINIVANAWACALYWKHCSFATSAKTYRDGNRYPVEKIKNIATAKTHGVNASVGISGGKGKGGAVSLTAEGTDKNSKTLTWTNTSSDISDVAGTADCGMFSTYFSVTSEGWFEHKGAKGYVSAGVRN